ncbi:MAG: glycosyltransferase [Nanoarchaeota archaeon]|nr:glycosyltransferase [Nanoarchaeota archaeon]
MLSRILGSFFYRSYKKRLNEDQRKILRAGYEPTLSIVIPCKNEGKVIYHTMQKCLETNYPKKKIEIIAINDGSTDNTYDEMLRLQRDYNDRKVKIINFKKNKGKRRAMYLGFKRAKGEIILQIDSDSYPEENAFKKIVMPFIDKRVGATVGHTDPANKDKNLMTKVQTAYYFMSFRALKATESIFDMVFCCSGCFSAYRKEYVLPVLDKWIEEKFMGKEIIFGDDRALTNWIIREGYKTIYVAEALAYTVVPEKLKQFFKQQVRWKKGWFINSTRILPEIIRRDKFVAFTYFIPLIILTLTTPFIAFKALILNPLIFGISPFHYVIGIMLVSFLLYTHYTIYSKEGYGKYMIVWSILNMTIFSYILLYALYDLRNMAWGTR